MRYLIIRTRGKPLSSETNWKHLYEKIASAVSLSRRPVAVSFLDVPPPGVPKFEGVQPSGCSFWRLAATGGAFYTVPGDHFNCPVGAYTHNIALSPEREQETSEILKMMFDLGYVKPEEVPQIPRLPNSPSVILYAPLGDGPVAPDVVLIACKPSAAMLLNEAANRAGVASGTPPAGPPDLHGLARIFAARRNPQLGLHGQSRLHRPRRKRNVHRSARSGSRCCCRRTVDHRRRQQRAQQLCQRPPLAVGHELIATSAASLRPTPQQLPMSSASHSIPAENLHPNMS